MKKLSKQTVADRDEINGRLNEHNEALNEAVGEFNTKRQEAWAKLEAALEEFNDAVESAWNESVGPVKQDYNDAVGDFNNWLTEVAQEIQGHIDSKSEKWQESDAGRRYQSWQSSYDRELPTMETEGTERIEIDEPDDVEIDLEDADFVIMELAEELPE